jgi:hypothetical protein
MAAIGPLAAGAMNPEQVGALLAAEYRRWGDATREIGLLPE